MNGSRKYGSGHGQGYGLHGYTVKAEAKASGSALGGLGMLVVYVIGALVLAQFALPILAGLGF